MEKDQEVEPEEPKSKTRKMTKKALEDHHTFVKEMEKACPSFEAFEKMLSQRTRK